MFVSRTAYETHVIYSIWNHQTCCTNRVFNIVVEVDELEEEKKNNHSRPMYLNRLRDIIGIHNQIVGIYVGAVFINRRIHVYYSIWNSQTCCTNSVFNIIVEVDELEEKEKQPFKTRKPQ